jgi:xanthine dehydrogenase large subunit
MPDDFRVSFLQGAAQPAVVFGSKAVGEPPLMLAISVFRAISDAIASLADHRVLPALDAPATPERSCVPSARSSGARRPVLAI